MRGIFFSQFVLVDFPQVKKLPATYLIERKKEIEMTDGQLYSALMIG